MRSRFDMMKIALPLALVVVAGFVVAFQFVKPAPPRTITIAAGPRDGAYFPLAEALSKKLAEQGITAHVQETAGTAANIARLAGEGGKADVAFVQSGVVDAADHPDLLSLGSLYLEPLWVFARGGAVDDLDALRGQRLFLGAPGSGTRALALRLLGAVGLAPGAYEDRAYPTVKAAAAALRAGEIDGLFTVVSPRAAIVRDLLATPGITLVSFRRAEAIARNYPFLSAADLPEGTIDLARDLPRARVALVAASANLVVHDDLHPALQELLVMIAQSLPQETSLIAPGRTFPSREALAFPLSAEAERIYTRGPSFLMRVLPFWVANYIDRFLVMLVPLLTLAVPLFRIFPPVYRWRVRSRIYRWYRDLRALDRSAIRGTLAPERALERLDAIETEVRQISVPLAYADEAYNLRLHIRYLRDLLEARIKGQQPGQTT